jgi:hypothetical protein
MTEPEADDTPETPREPEIELLGKLARGGLFVLRMAFLAAGVAALGYGLKKTLTIGDGWAWGALEFRSTPSAAGFVWMTVGLPLALPANTLLDRGLPQAALLLTSAAMWFGPMALADDSAYGLGSISVSRHSVRQTTRHKNATSVANRRRIQP